MRVFSALLALLFLGACSGTDMGEEATTDIDVTSLADIPVKKDDDNSPPRLHKVGNKEVQVGEELEILLAADDDDGDNVTFSAYGDMPKEAKFYKPEGRLVWTPSSAGGPFFITFVVSDLKDFDSETVELRAVTSKSQHAPHFEPLGDQFLQVNELYELRLEASDEDGDMLFFKALSGMPEPATFDAQNALFRWTPTQEHAGTQARITFQVSDGNLTDEMEVRLTVAGGELNNAPPQVPQISPIETAVGQQVTFIVQASDPDNDPITIAIDGVLPDKAQFNTANNTFTWTPPAAYAGKSENIVFLVSDGTYQVTLMVNILVKSESVTCGDDAFEPNNTPATATQVTEGTFANLSICDTETTPIDEDWFKLLLEKGEYVEATITANHDLGNLDLPLYANNSFDVPAAYAPVDGDEESISYFAPAAGTYFLRVAGTDGWKYAVPYTLTITRSQGSGCPADAFEPNDSIAAAAPLTGGQVDGDPIAGLQICAGDKDLFKVSLGTGDSLVAVIDFTDADGDLDLRLKDAAGQQLDESATVGDSEMVFIEGAAAAGSYYLEVSGYTPTTTNSYSMEVLVETNSDCAPDSYESNNSLAAAVPLAESGLLNGLTLCGDADWYQLTPQGGPVHVQLEGAQGLSAAFVFSATPSSKQAVPCSDGLCIGTQTPPFDSALYLVVEGPYGSGYSLELDYEAGSTQGSCVDKCDQDGGGCWCDESCVEYGDCCPDACSECGYCTYV